MTTSEKIVVVTGAAGGIGESVCQAVTELGWTPFGVDRRSGGAVDVVVDLADASAIDADLAPRLATVQGSIFGLVNAAGHGYKEPFLEASDESWYRVLESNLMSTVRMCRLVLPMMVDMAGDRSIVNFGSQAGKSGGLVIGAQYAAAKAAVMCLTKSLAANFGPRGVRVNAVAPGIIETPFLDDVPEMREMGPKLPLRRLGVPSDVAHTVTFLLGEGASYITGEIIDINGGLLMD